MKRGLTTTVDTRDLTLRRGAIGFLQKPFSERSLLDLLEVARTEKGVWEVNK